MNKKTILDSTDERKDILLTDEHKIELNKVMNNQINILTEFQKKLDENGKNLIDFNEVKDTIFKTEYFLYKLKSTL